MTNDEAKKRQAMHEKTHGMSPLEYQLSDQRLLYRIEPALQEKIDQIRQWELHRSRGNILAHYELGSLVLEVCDASTSSGLKYGEKPIRTIGLVLPWCKTSLYEALWFVRAYTREEAEQLADMHTAAGCPLTWSHVRSVQAVKDKATRQALLVRALHEDWTADDLCLEVRRLVAPRAAPKARPALPEPRGLEGVIEQQRQLAGKFLLGAETVWQGEHSLTDGFFALPTARRTEEGLQELQEHRDLLWRLAREAEAKAQEADQVLARYRQALEALSRATDSADEDAADEDAA